MPKKNTIIDEKLDNDNSSDYLNARTQRLQAIVDTLNANELPIDKLVEHYAEGMQIAKECKIYLSQVEGKIIDITKTFE